VYGKRVSMYRNLTLCVRLLAFLTAAPVDARSPQVHRLEATHRPPSCTLTTGRKRPLPCGLPRATSSTSIHY